MLARGVQGGMIPRLLVVEVFRAQGLTTMADAALLWGYRFRLQVVGTGQVVRAAYLCASPCLSLCSCNPSNPQGIQATAPTANAGRPGCAPLASPEHLGFVHSVGFRSVFRLRGICTGWKGSLLASWGAGAGRTLQATILRHGGIFM